MTRTCRVHTRMTSSTQPFKVGIFLSCLQVRKLRVRGLVMCTKSHSKQRSVPRFEPCSTWEGTLSGFCGQGRGKVHVLGWWINCGPAEERNPGPQSLLQL